MTAVKRGKKGTVRLNLRSDRESKNNERMIGSVDKIITEVCHQSLWTCTYLT